MSGITKKNTDMAVAKMGELLLKGYRMLDASCQKCNNVLMQDRNGDTPFCTLCGIINEIQEVTHKENLHQISSSLDKANNGAGEKYDSGTKNVNAAAIDFVISDMVEEMKDASNDLRNLRFEASDDSNLLTRRQDILAYIGKLLNVIKELQQIK